MEFFVRLVCGVGYTCIILPRSTILFSWCDTKETSRQGKRNKQRERTGEGERERETKERERESLTTKEGMYLIVILLLPWLNGRRFV